MSPPAIKVWYLRVIAAISVYKVRHSPLQASIPYDLLVGADGAASAVRSALQQIMPATYIRRYRHKQVYSMTQVTPANPAEIPPYTVFHAHSAKVGVLASRLSAALAMVSPNVHQQSVTHVSSSFSPKGAATPASVSVELQTDVNHVSCL